MTTISASGLRCSVFKRTLLAHEPDSHVINGICNADSLICRLPNSVVIWKNSIISHCPYKLVTSLQNLTHIGRDILMSEEGYAYKVNSVYHECNLTLYGTSEGLVLTFENEA